MAFRTKTYEAYGNIRVKPNQPCNYLNRGHKSKVNIFGQYSYLNEIFIGRLQVIKVLLTESIYVVIDSTPG